MDATCGISSVALASAVSACGEGCGCLWCFFSGLNVESN